MVEIGIAIEIETFSEKFDGDFDPDFDIELAKICCAAKT